MVFSGREWTLGVVFGVGPFFGSNYLPANYSPKDSFHLTELMIFVL